MNKSPVVFAIALLSASLVQAQDAAPAVVGNISLTTHYKFRGQDQGNERKDFQPAIQGGFDYANSGFYVGNWNSSIGWLDNSSIEMDFYGGYKAEFMPGFGYDVGVLTYVYPGTSAANTTELYAGVSYSFVSLKYFHTVSKKYFGFLEARNTGYLDLAANYEVVKGVTINAHVGTTRFSSDAKDLDQGAFNYTDYKIGATYDLGGGFAVAGALIGANKRSSYPVDLNKNRFVVTLTKTL